MAILKIRDNEGVITNIAAIKGENGKSPIIKLMKMICFIIYRH